MTNPFGSLARVILPLIIIYLAFSLMGTIGGIIVVGIFIIGAAYLNRAVIYQNRGSKKYKNGDFEGALSDLKTSISLNPNAVNIRGSYAFLLLKLGHTEEAAVQIDEALKRVQAEADKKSLRVTKALILWKQNKVDEAIEDLSELLKTFETTNVYATLGFLHIEKGDYEKALEFNLQAKDYNGTNAIILDNLGTSYFLLGVNENAFETFQETMKHKPNFPEALYNYARVLDKMGDLEKALYMVRHSLTLRFWNTSTITKKEVEDFLVELEAKENALNQIREAEKAAAKATDREAENDAENQDTEIRDETVNETEKNENTHL